MKSALISVWFWIGMLMTPPAWALDIAFRFANGDIVGIPDNSAGTDTNPTAGIIDLKLGERFGSIAFSGRAEETVAGSIRALRITATPGSPPQGYFRNNSTLFPREDLRVFAMSSTFAAIPAGSAWTLSYNGNTFDGNVPDARLCNGNGIVSIIFHTVRGRINERDILDTVIGPTVTNAPPGPFSVSAAGRTTVPATSLHVRWILLSEECDGIQFPSSIELALTPAVSEQELPLLPKILLILLVILGVLFVAWHRRAGMKG